MPSIRPLNLAGIDLNLVKVLHALLEERAVTAAGRRVGLSQPATSNALRRLRDLLRDELLVRGSDGLELTAYARELQASVAEAMEALGRAFRPPARFDPARASLTLRLAATDLAALAVLPRVWPLLAAEAPAIDLVVRSGDRDLVIEWLREGAIDLTLGVFPVVPGDCLTAPLFTESFELLLRPGHPLLEGELTPARLAEFPAILVSPRGDPRGIVDAALAELGLRRRVAVTVAHFLLAPHLLLDSDLTLVFPRSLAAAIAAPYWLVTRPLPLDLPHFTVEILWLRRNDAHPALTWLRGLIARAVDQSEPGAR
jgi:DNA-binding transcriptional LysR family regulator